MTDVNGFHAPRRIAVIGAPIDRGASQRGTLMGPAALRTAGLLTVLSSLGFDIADHGDLSVKDMADLADLAPARANHYREIQRWTRALSSRGFELARSGAIPIFLGGDHSLSMGSVNAMARHWRGGGGALVVLLRAGAGDNADRQHAWHGRIVPLRGSRPGWAAGRRTACLHRSRPPRAVRHALDR